MKVRDSPKTFDFKETNILEILQILAWGFNYESVFWLIEFYYKGSL